MRTRVVKITPLASSHSAPAVKSAIKVEGTRKRVASFAVWSTNLSAAFSKTKSPPMKAAMLKQTVSTLIILQDEILRRAGEYFWLATAVPMKYEALYQSGAILRSFK